MSGSQRLLGTEFFSFPNNKHVYSSTMTERFKQWGKSKKIKKYNINVEWEYIGAVRRLLAVVTRASKRCSVGNAIDVIKQARECEDGRVSCCN